MPPFRSTRTVAVRLRVRRNPGKGRPQHGLILLDGLLPLLSRFSRVRSRLFRKPGIIATVRRSESSFVDIPAVCLS